MSSPFFLRQENLFAICLCLGWALSSFSFEGSLLCAKWTWARCFVVTQHSGKRRHITIVFNVIHFFLYNTRASELSVCLTTLCKAWADVWRSLVLFYTIFHYRQETSILFTIKLGIDAETFQRARSQRHKPFTSRISLCKRVATLQCASRVKILNIVYLTLLLVRALEWGTMPISHEALRTLLN